MVMYMQLLKLNKQEKKRNLIEALRFFFIVELIVISVIRQIKKMLYLDIDRCKGLQNNIKEEGFYYGI